MSISWEKYLKIINLKHNDRTKKGTGVGPRTKFTFSKQWKKGVLQAKIWLIKTPPLTDQFSADMLYYYNKINNKGITKPAENKRGKRYSNILGI